MHNRLYLIIVLIFLLAGLGAGAGYIHWRHATREKNNPATLTIANWFEVTFDKDFIYQNASPPGQAAWKQQFRWADIIRICYETEEKGTSNGLYFFTSLRPESYAIPLQGKGGAALWNEVIRRGLFDQNLAREASSCVEDKTFFWPPLEKKK